MRRHSVIAALPLIFVMGPVMARETPAPSPAPTAAPARSAGDVAAALRDAEMRGLAIYRYDQAAWHSTDALQRALPAPRQQQIAGWVVTPAGETLKITYFGRTADRFFAIYSAVWAGGTSVRQEQVFDGDTTDLVGEELRLARIFSTFPALSALRTCGQLRPNIVLLPASVTGANDSMYIITPQPRANVFAAGGHYRIDYVDGVPQAPRAFTRSCLDLAATPPRGGTPAALVVSHLLDPQPTEIHVYLALLSHLPLYVITSSPDTLWQVEPSARGARIRLMQENFRPPAA